MIQINTMCTSPLRKFEFQYRELPLLVRDQIRIFTSSVGDELAPLMNEVISY